MKITAVECTVIYARRRRAFGKAVVTGLGQAALSEYALVELKTDIGISGFGEIASVFDKKGTQLAAEVRDRLAPLLVGQDPMRIAALNAAMRTALSGSEPALAGVDIALHDLVGKALDSPVYNLLGGLSRPRIALSYSIPFGAPDEMAVFALDRVGEGFRTVKVKIGQGHDRDVEAVRRVREAVGPDIRVRVDANMSFSDVASAVRTIRALEPFSPELIEQPLTRERIADMALIRADVDAAIMADESIWSPADTLAVIMAGAADVANIYVMESGGLQAAVTSFRLCELAGMRTMIGSMPELGIGTAAQIHLGCAMPNLDIDSDCCGSLYHEEDYLLTPLHIEGGYAYPPVGAGLGVEVDAAVIERWRKPPDSDAAGT